MKLLSTRVLAGLLAVTGLVIAQEQSLTNVAGPKQPEVPSLAGGIPPVEVREPGPQEVQLNKPDYKDNWRQAGAGDGRLGDRLRSHIVRLDGADTLNGRLTVIDSESGKLEPIQDVKVRFVREGVVKAEISPDANGEFLAKDLKPGVYSMIAVGEDGFLAWSVNVEPKLADVARMPRHLRAKFLRQEVKNELDVQAAAVPPRNFTPLKQLLTQYLPSEDSTLYMDAEDFPEGMQDDPPRDADPGTSLLHHQIRLTEDGRLLGRVRRLQPDSGRDLKIRQLNVFLLKGEEISAQEEVSPNGTFAFEDLKPGVYSMVAAGRDGFLAFSIDVLASLKKPINTDVTRKDGLTTVALRREPAGLQIDVALCSPMDFNQENLAELTDGFVGGPQQLAMSGEASAPPGTGPGGSPGAGAPAGPPGGGNVGGGGGGSGGGGLGGVLLGGAIGAGIGTILADDDNGNRPQASPSSPTGQ